MSITLKRSSITTVLGVAMLLTAAMSGALAAAPTVDSETTTTTSTSALTDGATVDSFNASDTNISTLQASYDSQNPGIAIVDPETGDTLKTVTNTSNPGYFTSTGGTGPYYFNTTFSEADFATVPMGAGENKSVTLRLINDTSVSTDSWDTTNITITLANTNERAVVTASSSAQESGLADVEEEDSLLPEFLGGDTENVSTVEQDNVAIAGDETTLYVVYEDGSVAESYENAAANKSRLGISAFASDYETADRIRDHIVRVEDTPYAVYSGEAPEDVLDATGATYAVYETVDGEPAHKIELGDAVEDETTVDVVATGNDTLGLFEAAEVFGDGLFSMSLGVLGGALVLFGRPAWGDA